MDAESEELFLDSWQLEAPEEPVQDWILEPHCANHDSESEDALHAVDPNEVFPSGPPADPSSSESDSGISEDPAVDKPVALTTPATVYQVVYDISEPGRENVIAIELGDLSSQMLFSESCVVSELPAMARLQPPSPDDSPWSADLQLTEEEQKLLTQEGVSLPSNLPLTKAEERVLKKVRRKIRNKQSAQDSRRRRKEYMDGLENRAAACSAQNKELQRTVEQLEKQNMSLLAQLRQFQTLIKQTVSKGAQTSTCLLIILVSLGLIIMPSFSPFRRHVSVDDDYRPVGVISRNILTDPASSQSAVKPHPSSPPPDLSQSGAGEAETPEGPGVGGVAPEGNGSLPVSGPTGGGSREKPAHADEM